MYILIFFITPPSVFLSIKNLKQYKKHNNWLISSYRLKESIEWINIILLY